MMLTDLADVLRRAGLRVIEEPGWKTRGHGPMTSVTSITLHHTAGPATGEAPSLGVVRDGRTGLPGPLAQLVLGRSGTWYVVAAGLAYHAGVTFYAWQGNAYAIGIEAEATGTSPWPAEQYASFVRGARALADRYGVPYDRVMGHKEVAYPQGRKVDPNFDCAAFRAALNAPQEEDMSWTEIVTNMNGDKVQAIQVLNGVEVRTANAQTRLGAVEGKLDELKTAVSGIMPGPINVEALPIDLDALAEKVADVLAARLAS